MNALSSGFLNVTDNCLALETMKGDSQLELACHGNGWIFITGSFFDLVAQGSMGSKDNP